MHQLPWAPGRLGPHREGYMWHGMIEVCEGMAWHGMVEVCEGAPVAVSGWVLTRCTSGL